MKRLHRMAFGAEVSPTAGVRFRLWAPAVPAVTLGLGADAEGVEIPMVSTGDGWFTAEVRDAGAGTRYRFRLPEGLWVPDPASRFQPDGVHGASEVVDPGAFAWRDGGWRGRPLHELVVYELHVGAFTAAGTFDGVVSRLDELAKLGVTAIELMPVAAGPGRRGWGYDGVYPFAPHACYGRPEDLKRLVEAAHARHLMVLLDVVYNHFGPEGNYLARYAPAFFTDRHRTPWGAAIDFEGPSSRTVRDFFVHNALYWLEEYHLDGLRLDAVHAIHDATEPDVLTAIAEAVHRASPGRHVHLVLENDDNHARRLERADGAPRWYAAQWNDDLHHAAHVCVTGEQAGYYADYGDDPVGHLGRALAEGFVYQGEPSAYRGGMCRGEPSAHLPPLAFVSFLQNHDQVGNRAFGERLVSLAAAPALRAATALLLLAPAPPLLFMGEEWGTAQPFPFFCDFGPELAAAVREGRRREFARFPAFQDAEARARIPDPGAAETFAAAVLRWEDAVAPAGRRWRALHRRLLAIRRREIMPRLAAIGGHAGSYERLGARGLRVRWRLADGSMLAVVANLGAGALAAQPPPGQILWPPNAAERRRLAAGSLPGWGVVWGLARAVADEESAA
jgi:maltooligosyltrehalose trehalohydrolase